MTCIIFYLHIFNKGIVRASGECAIVPEAGTTSLQNILRIISKSVFIYICRAWGIWQAPKWAVIDAFQRAGVEGSRTSVTFHTCDAIL